MNSSTINITEVISNSINTLFNNLFSSIDNNTYLILDEITFINPDIFNDTFLQKIIGNNCYSGILLVCNSLLIGFIIFYGIHLLYSHFVSNNIEKPFQFLFKLFIFSMLMNYSFFICEQIVNINSLISLSIREVGENTLNIKITFSELILKLNSIISIGQTDFNLFSMDGIIKSFISIELINLIFTYSIRYILVKIFIIFSPFAFLSLIFNSTSWFFKSWLRAFISLLFIQSFVGIILLIVFSININSDNLLLKLLYLASLYTLTKANIYIKELIGGINTTFSNSLTTLKSFLK